MFVPLEPRVSDGSAEINLEIRCDVACCNYPPAMHIQCLTPVPADSPGSYNQINESGASASNTLVVTSRSQPITQLDAALRREGSPDHGQSGPHSSPNNIDGWPTNSLARVDAAHQFPQAAHKPRSPRKGLLPDFPRDLVQPNKAQNTAGPGTIAHSAAPLEFSTPSIENRSTSSSDQHSTFRTYAQSTTGLPVPAPVSWSHGLLESARRRDWFWPKVVDELIGRRWDSIHQLGRTALGNSRDETRRVLVTSVKRGDGRTTIALALARWAAMTGNRTLLVDADIAHPGVANALHLTSPGDWRTNTLGFTVDNNIVSCRSLPLSLLPLIANPQLEAGPAAIEQLMMQLAVAEQEFDCCIIDAGPIDMLCQQIATVTRLATSIVVVNNHQHGMSPLLISACNTLWQLGKPAVTIADNLHG